MIFKSKWSKAIYIIRPTVRGVNHLGIVNVTPGLRAMFDLNQTFDSKEAQERQGWTDEERLAVEEALIKHKDYGNGLVLMPGQEIPESLRGIVERKSGAKVAPLCDFVQFIDGKVDQCQNTALPGSEKCDDHKARKSQVVKGMLTAS